jgi:hypothetical protein
MKTVVPGFLALGDAVAASGRLLGERGHPRLDSPDGGPPPAELGRVLILVAPDVAAAAIADLEQRLDGAGLLVLITCAPGSDPESRARFIELLGACQKLAGRRRAATIVGSDLASLTPLAALAAGLDEHLLIGPAGAAGSFVEAQTEAVRSCPTGKDSAALVTSDVSDHCLVEALSLLLASQLVDHLLDPEPVSKGSDATAITRRIPSWVVDANRPLRELLDSMQVELALPAVREPVALQAAIDQAFAVAREEIGRERQQLMEQVSARLRGGTGSRTGKRQAGFLGAARSASPRWRYRRRQRRRAVSSSSVLARSASGSTVGSVPRHPG